MEPAVAHASSNPGEPPDALPPARRRGLIERRRLAACVLALAIVVRVLGAYYANTHQDRFDYPDSRRYALVARNFSEGRGLIETTHNRTGNDPILPLLLSPAWLMPGATLHGVYDWARIINIAFGLLCLLVVMRWARELGGTTAELLAGLIFALDPILLFFHLLPLTEIPFIGALWLGLFAVWRCIGARSVAWAGTAGVSLAVAALSRSSALPLVMILPAFVLARRRGMAGVCHACVMWAIVAACITPFAYRNYKLLGQWVPVRTGSGATLLESLGPWADGGPGMEKVVWPPTPPGANELEQDIIYRNTALAWAREHPAQVLQLAVTKVLRTWSPAPHAPGYAGALFAWIGWLSVLPVYVLALWGIARLWHADRSSACLLLAPALYLTMVHALFVGSVRYRVPVMPGLFVLAAVGAAQIPRRRKVIIRNAESPPHA